MPVYHSQLHRPSTGDSFVGHTYSEYRIDELSSRTAESIVTALTENAIMNNGGSDTGENVLTSTDGVRSVDTIALQAVIASRNFDPLVSTYNGVKIFTEIGSGGGGWIRVDSSSAAFNPVTISSEEATFKMVTGQRKAFVNAIENNRAELLQCVGDRISSNVALLEDEGILECITESRKIPGSLCEMSADQVLDRMLSMSCVFICFMLALCSSPVLDRIRTIMKIDNGLHSYCDKSIALPLFLKNLYLPFTGYRKSVDRANTLIVYLQYLLQEHRGVEHVSCTDAVSKDEVSYLALKCGLDNVIVNKGLYEQSMSYGLVANKCAKDGGAHASTFFQANKGRPSVYHIGQLDRKQPHRKQNDRGKCYFPMIFLVSMEGNLVKHVDIECNAGRAVRYYRNVIMTANPVSMTRAVLDENGAYKLSDVNDETEQIKGHNVLYDIKHTPILFDAGVSSAGRKKSTHLDIDTVGKLSELIDRIKEVDDEFFASYTSIHIEETAFSMSPTDKGVVLDASKPPVEIVDTVKNRAISLKEITGLLLENAVKDQLSVIIESTELGTSKHFLRRATEIEKDRCSEVFQIALKRANGGVYVAREELFDSNGLSIVSIDHIEKVVIGIGEEQYMKICQIYGSARPSDKLQRKVISDKSLHPMFPCVYEIFQRGQNVLDAELEMLDTEEKRDQPNESRITQLKKSIELCKKRSTWAARDLIRYNFLFFNATYDTINSHLTTKSKRIVHGVDVLKRCRIAPAIDVLQEKCTNSSSYDTCIIPYASSGSYEDGTSLMDLDIKRQYSSNMMGSGTTLWNRDFFGQLPAIVMERNLIRGDIVRPIISYYSQCCIVNFDPSEVDATAYKELDYRFNRDGSTLYGTLGAVNGPRVITSANLINWTMDLWKFKKRIHEYRDFVKFANHFQFDILKIKTGRFVYDEPTRAFLWSYMARTTDLSPCDNGEDVYTRFDEIDSTIAEGFGKMFIFPVDKPILEGLVYDADGSYVDSVDNISIDLAGNDLLMHDYEDWFHGKCTKRRRSYDKLYGGQNRSIVFDTIIDSCRVFQLMAKSILNLNHLSCPSDDGKPIVDKDAVKEILNTALGKTRQTKQLSIQVQRSSTLASEEENNAIVVNDVAKCDPSTVVFTTAFTKLGGMIVEKVKSKRQLVRNSLEGLRDVVAHLAARQIEKVSYSLKEGSEICRIKTDGIQVSLDDAPDAIEAMKVATGHVDNGRSNGLPGQCIGMTEQCLDSAALHDDNKYGCIINHKRSNNWATGVYGATSEWKNQLDSAKWNTYKESEFRVAYHKSVGEPFAYALCKPYTAAELLEFVRKPVHSLLLKQQIESFEKMFGEWEVEQLISMDRLAISGPPGNGKSYVARKIIEATRRTVAENNKANNKGYIFKSASIGPYHSNKEVFADCVTETYTMHSATGHGKVMDKLKFAPKPSSAVGSFVDPLLWREKARYDYIIVDETCATSVDAEEALFNLTRISKNTIIIGDQYQGKPPTGAGLSLIGPTVKHLCNSNMYIKDVPYRNKDPKFNENLAKIRAGCSTSVYLDPGMCEHHKNASAMIQLRAELTRIASGLVDSNIDTALICQSHNAASVFIHTIVRAAVLMKTPIFTLTYIGECNSVKKRAGIETIELYGDKESKGVKVMDTHEQSYYGMPMVFYNDCEYVVKCSFSPQFSLSADAAKKKRDKAKLVRAHMPRLDKAIRLRYISHSKRYCILSPRKSKKKTKATPTSDPPKRKLGVDGNPLQYIMENNVLGTEDEIGRNVLLIKFENMNTGETYTLSEFEVTSFLMYPFVSQRCNVIGQTMERVVMVQLCVRKRGFRKQTDDPTYDYTRTYEPMSLKLKKIENMYGSHAALTATCREMQVIASRVKTGERTKVLDVSLHGLGFYKNFTYAAYTGANCDGYCARFTAEDRLDADNKLGTVQVFNNHVREIVRLRALKLVVKCKATGHYNDALFFPHDRLCVHGITEDMFLDEICMSPKYIEIVNSRKRKSEDTLDDYLPQNLCT